MKHKVARVTQRRPNAASHIRHVPTGTAICFRKTEYKRTYEDALASALWVGVSQHLDNLNKDPRRNRIIQDREFSVFEQEPTSEPLFTADHIQDSEWEDDNGLYLVDSLTSAALGKHKRKNNDNLRAEAANWQSTRDSCSTAYRNLGNTYYSHQCLYEESSISVCCISFTGFESKTFAKCAHRTFVQQIIHAGFFPSTPKLPKYAFSIDMLRLFHCISEHGKCSKSAFALGVLAFLEQQFTTELLRTKVRHHFPELFRDAYAQWITIDAITSNLVNTDLNKLHSIERSADSAFAVGALHEMCPACFGWTAEEKLLSDNPPSLIFCLDGNMQHKRFKRDIDGEGPYVHPTYTYTGAQWDRLPGFNPDDLNNTLRPGKALGCERHSYAADEVVLHGANIDEPGVVLASCRHGSQLRLFDMLPGRGERRVYAVLLAEELLRSNPEAKGFIMYDIACQFESYAKRQLPERLTNASFAVPALHGYAHDFACQVNYHCRFQKGFAQTDGEGVERNWSEMDRLVGPLRQSSKSRRRLALCNFVRSAANCKRLTFGSTLQTRWQRACQRQRDSENELIKYHAKAAMIEQDLSYQAFCSGLWHDIEDRRSYFARNRRSNGSGRNVPDALTLEPIDQIFEHLLFSSGHEFQASLDAGLVGRLSGPLSGNVETIQINYRELHDRLQGASTGLLHDPTIIEEILVTNGWVKEHFDAGKPLFKRALGRGLSREIIRLRQRIWIKWADHMSRSKRLRATKTGERQSAMILRSMNSASATLRALVREHNSIVDEMASLVPEEPSHSKLTQNRLGDDIQSAGFLLMPATMMQHRWMTSYSRICAMEHIEIVARAEEEQKLLQTEVARLLIWYSARMTTITTKALGSPMHEWLFTRLAFFEARCLTSLMRALQKIPEMAGGSNVTPCFVALDNLARHMSYITIERDWRFQDAVHNDGPDEDKSDADEADRLEAEEGDGLDLVLRTLDLGQDIVK